MGLSIYRRFFQFMKNYNATMRAVHRKSGNRYFASGNTRKLPSASNSVLYAVAATGFVGLTGTAVYYARCSLKINQAIPDDVFVVPFVDEKSADTLYRYKNMWFPKVMFPNRGKLEVLQAFSLSSDDVLVVSFPKSGTTWLQQIVWLISSNATDGDIAEQSNIELLFPYLEYDYPGLKEIALRPSPRLLKSHMPYAFLPSDIQKGKGKVIYIARNPKDVCVSYYHFHRMLSFVKYTGSFVDFFNMFVSGKVAYGPWKDHVIGFWQRRNDNNILFVTYENLHMNPVKTVREIAHFLGKSLTDQQVFKIIQLSKFDEMSNNPNVNYSWWDDLGLRLKNEAQFFRKGIIGDWKNFFTEDMEKVFEDSFTEPLKLEGLNLTDKTV